MVNRALSSGRGQERDRLAGEGERGVNGEADRKDCSQATPEHGVGPKS